MNSISFDDYIFEKPSFFRGVARVMDIGGSLGKGGFVMSRTAAEADERALASDFRVVNRDLHAAAATAEAALPRVDAEE